MNDIKKDFFWSSLYNAIIGVFNSIILMICIRINGVTISGKFIIILTNVNLIALIGEYGLRTFQVTDVKREFSFGEYLLTKIFLLICMILVSFGYLLYKNYILQEFLIFVALLILKIFDNLSELFQGELQLRKMLYLTSKYAFVRVLLYLIVFMITDIITKNIVIATFSMMITNIILFVCFDLILLHGKKERISSIDKENIKIILKKCFPIFIIALLNTYIINSVKYILDIYNMYDLQTYYNIICIIMFVLNLLAIFIIKPLLGTLATLYKEKFLNKFQSYILRLTGCLCICALLVEIILFFFGTNIITLVYGINVDIYKQELCITVIGSLFYALTTLVQTILTIMGKQKKLILAYLFTALICIIITYCIKDINMLIIVWVNNIIMFILLLLSCIILFKEIYNVKKV